MSWTGVIVTAVFVGLAIFVVAVIRWEIPRGSEVGRCG